MQKNKHNYAVIMAGGGGTRLWPLSRKATPKQLLTLFNGKTLFKIAVDRLVGEFAPENVFVVTVAEQSERLSRITPQIPRENFLIEPMPRGTAAVVVLAAAAIQKKDPQAVMVVLTADHFIENVEGFLSILQAACHCAQENWLVTLGVKPTFPSTGYGYIESGEIVSEYRDHKVLRALRFEEKPDVNRAIDFIKSGKYYWNSGMFVWRVDEIIKEFAKFMPALHESITRIMPYIGVTHDTEEFVKEWLAIQPQTIDYGIMEKSDRVAVIPAIDLGWNDVGSWDSLFEVMPADEQGNILLTSDTITLDSRNSLIYSDEENKKIVTLGVQNMIIINTPDALLICPRGESQKVKILVEYLKTNHYTPFL
jgi:mannose-1-phosphate guanylyltransferase